MPGGDGRETRETQRKSSFYTIRLTEYESYERYRIITASNDFIMSSLVIKMQAFMCSVGCVSGYKYYLLCSV